MCNILYYLLSYMLVLCYHRTTNIELVSNISISLFDGYKFIYKMFVKITDVIIILRSNAYTGILVFVSRCLVKNINILIANL